MDDRIKQLLILGREHYDRREWDRAEDALRQVLEKTDRFADVHNMLGVIGHEHGDFVGAQASFERAVELNPNYTEALLNLAVTYNDLGKYEAAREVYGRIQTAHPKEGKAEDIEPYALGKIANMHAELATAYADAGARDEAISQLKRAIALRPKFADLQVRLGTLYRDAGELELARDCFRAARDQNPNYAQARVLLGATLLALGDTESAQGEWRHVIQHDPDNRAAKLYLRMVDSQR